MSLDLDKIRKAFLGGNHVSTHWDGCEYSHWRCATLAMIREIEGLRDKNQILGWYIDAAIMTEGQRKKKYREPNAKEIIHKVKTVRPKLPKSRRVPLVRKQPDAPGPKAKGKRR